MEEIDPRVLKYKIIASPLTIKEVAKEAGVGINTARLGLSGANITIHKLNALIRAYKRLTKED